MSHKYRIGNNLEIQWTVNLHRSDGTLVDLTSLNLGVQLIVGQKVYEVQNPTIAANLITFLYPGADQHYDGPYVVKLYDKDNTTITYDVRNAFILTDSSWTADSVYVPEDITVEIETDINAVQIVAIAGPKGDKGDKGDTGSKGDAGEDGADGANGYDGVDGKDGADGKDGQDGRNGVDGKDGEPGRSIRKSVFEVGKMYYNGKVLSDDGVYYLDIVTDTAVAMADEEVNYYLCKDTHLSTENEDLDDRTLWTPMSEMDPIVTPLVLAQQIDAEFIDVDSLVAKKVTVTDSENNVIAKIGDMSDYVVEEQTKKYPFWIGGATPATAVTRIDSTGKLTTVGIKATGSLESTKVEEEFEGNVKMDGGSLTYNISGNGYGGSAVVGYRTASDKALISLYPSQEDPGLYIEHQGGYQNSAAMQLVAGQFSVMSNACIVMYGNSYIEFPGNAQFKGFKTPIFRVTQTGETNIGGGEGYTDYHTIVIYNTSGVTLKTSLSPLAGAEFDIICVHQGATLNLNGQAGFYINDGTLTEYGSAAAESIALSNKHHYRLFYDGTCWFITE